MHGFQKQKWKMESSHRILIYKSCKNCMIIILDGEKKIKLEIFMEVEKIDK